jgi:outer membrane protein OmpA-like peptidoglycan-associated protein
MPDLHEPTTSTAPHPNGNLEELQKLLLEAERGRLDKLEGGLNQLDDHVKNKVIDASAVAKVLPDAICLRAKQDQYLKESLEITIVQTLMHSVRKSPGPVVDAIYPVMGPAIRKYIEDALQGMVRRLEHSGLSRRGLTWRWEAWKTRKSFGAVVLSHTVRYQVERVFLFFREDGIHLADVHLSDAPALGSGHKDLVTSMFSEIQMAVQRFAHDEFQVSEHSSMKEITMDGKMVFIEHGPKAVLAAVVRGIPPQSLRTKLQNALESIHVELSEALQNFRGDKKPFEAARPYLESCLLHEESDAPNENGSARGGLLPALVVMLILLLIWIVWGSITSYLERQRWADFQDRAREKPGIHITSINTVDGKTIVYGLRDPLSDSPQSIARDAGLSDEVIDFQFEPYFSLVPKLTERRAREILHAPDSVRLSVPNGTTVLNIAGIAPHAWFVQLRKASATIPGITSIQDAELQDESRVHLAQLVQEIESYHVDFEAGSASLAAESGAVLQAVRRALGESDGLAQQLGSRMRVEIRGNTSEEGSAETNRRLALARAQWILSALNIERFRAIDLLAIAESVGSSAAAEIQGSKPQRERRVSFHVTINDSESTGLRP